VQWKGRPLADLSLRKGNWTYAQEFEAVETAHDWGIRPSELGICSPDEDMAVMTAYTRTISRMRAWEAQEQERKLKSPKRPGIDD
jgi:hypothetical protein